MPTMETVAVVVLVVKNTTNTDAITMIPEQFPNALVRSSHKRYLGKNETLFRPSDEVTSLYFIIEGELIALRQQLDGKQAIMMRSIAGKIFAPVSLNMTLYPCSAIASTATTLLQIPKTIFIKHLESHTEFSRYYINSLSQDLKQQCIQSERLRLKKAKDRILHYITCESPNGKEILLSSTMSKWAEELGIEPESLYRTLSKLEKDGVITRTKRKITLLK